jgi:hypothetical protein
MTAIGSGFKKIHLVPIFQFQKFTPGGLLHSLGSNFAPRVRVENWPQDSILKPLEPLKIISETMDAYLNTDSIWIFG